MLHHGMLSQPVPSALARAHICPATQHAAAPCRAALLTRCIHRRQERHEAPCISHAASVKLLQSRSCWQHGKQRHIRKTVVAVAKAASAQHDAREPGTATIAAAVGGLLLLGTSNRVLYRMALVPMRDYIVFLAQFQNLFYVIAYFTLLWLRYRSGKVTAEMLAVPKGRFVMTGACEAVAQLMLMAGAAHLPGAMLPLLAQTMLVWNVVFSATMLGKRPSIAQLVGVALVCAGVGLASLPPSAAGGVIPASLFVAQPHHVAFALVSYAFPALATIIKEQIFTDASKRLGGQQLDVLVVNSFCSAAQAIFVLLLLPFTSIVRGMHLSELPSHVVDGGRCLMGLTPSCGGDCSGSPLLPILYVSVNICFNILALYMVRTVGAVSAGLVASSLVPFSILAFTLPLPYLGASQLGGSFLWGAGLLCCGMLLYNIQGIRTLLTHGGEEPRPATT